jgi:hypothetical protein
MVRWSVVWLGIVHVRKTLWPFRTTRKSLTGLGSSSEGGRGIPGVPQPLSKANPSEQKKIAEIGLVRRREKSVSEEESKGPKAI